jgi:hypothetical protein
LALSAQNEWMLMATSLAKSMAAASSLIGSILGKNIPMLKQGCQMAYFQTQNPNLGKLVV